METEDGIHIAIDDWCRFIRASAHLNIIQIQSHPLQNNLFGPSRHLHKWFCYYIGSFGRFIPFLKINITRGQVFAEIEKE